MRIFDQNISVQTGNPFSSEVFTVGATTSEIIVTIPREAQWIASSRIGVEIAVIVSGVEYKATGSATGGERLDKNGNPMPFYQLRYRPPVVQGGTKRIGETGVKTECVLRVRGNADIHLMVDVLEAPAPVSR